MYAPDLVKSGVGLAGAAASSMSSASKLTQSY